jgi:hypothetical protein
MCPACHHHDHDPGACRECPAPTCELHTDDALAWVERIEPELLGARDGDVIEFLREALDMSDEWASIARAYVINKRKLAKMASGPSQA